MGNDWTRCAAAGIRFFHIAKDNFEWESQVSLDDGRTWSKTATLLASRALQ